MTTICPLCKAENCVDVRCYKNTEFYGSQTFNIPCTNCGQMLCIRTNRTVTIVSIVASGKKQIDEAL